MAGHKLAAKPGLWHPSPPTSKKSRSSEQTVLIVVARYVVSEGHDSTVARLYGGTTAAEERAGQPSRAGLPRILGLPGDRRSPGVPALRAVHQRGRLPGPPADAALRGHHRAAGRAAPGRACLDTYGTAAHLTSSNEPSAR